MKKVRRACIHAGFAKRYLFRPDYVVEMARVELASESISARVSPSAANVFLFRLLKRPLAGSRFGYPIVPLCYWELTQSFPVCRRRDSGLRVNLSRRRCQRLSCECVIVIIFSVYI